MKFLISISLLVSSFTWAATCKTINDCKNALSKKTNTNYVTAEELKQKGDFEIDLDSENADELFSHMLSSNGYTRLPISKNTYEIINARDVRYREFPIFEVSKSNAPADFKHNDHLMMKYKLVSNKVPAWIISRNLRPFMSRYGRIVDIDKTGMILVSDTAKNLKRIYQIIKEVDVELSDREFKEMVRKRDKRMNCENKKEIIREVRIEK